MAAYFYEFRSMPLAVATSHLSLLSYK